MSWNPWKHFPLVHLGWEKVLKVQFFNYKLMYLCFGTWHMCIQSAPHLLSFLASKIASLWPFSWLFPHKHIMFLLHDLNAQFSYWYIDVRLFPFQQLIFQSDAFHLPFIFQLCEVMLCKNILQVCFLYFLFEVITFSNKDCM